MRGALSTLHLEERRHEISTRAVWADIGQKSAADVECSPRSLVGQS